MKSQELFFKQNHNIINNCQSIPGRKLITQNEFQNLYLSKMLPVKIEEGVKEWKALSLWSPEYLGHVLAKENVMVAVSKKSVISYNKSHGSNLRFKEMNMKDAVSLVLNNKSLSKKYYIIHQSLVNRYNAIRNDFDIPSLVSKNKHYLINMWFGEAGNITPVHFDRPNNFLVQVFGRKRVKLYSPDDSAALYPTNDQKIDNHSKILDIDNPDYTKFPKFRNTTAYECILYPGDILFIPSGWWHQVYSLDISISVNFWWPPTIDEYLVSKVTRHHIKDLYEQGKLPEISKILDLNKCNNHLEIANYLNSKDYKWIAILFCMDFFETKLRQSLAKKGYTNISNDQINHGLAFFIKYKGVISTLLDYNITHLVEWINNIKLALKEDDNLLIKANVEKMINKVSLLQEV